MIMMVIIRIFMISGGILVLWIMMMILMRKELKDPWELLKRKKLFQNDDNTCAVARIHFHLKLHLTSDQCHWHWRWKGQFHWYLPDSGRDRLWLDIQSRWSSSLAWLYRRNPLPPEEKVDQKKRRKKWWMILQHFHRFTHRRIRRGRQFFSCESSPELIFSQNLYVQYCHASRWQWLWWL